ncbi:reticulon-like protein B8 [Primulina eburnea]|uniref:reticulon-like protein B8 n=1 Tax=Primulina eburnea TaxID=1245227 RepID=UPI003C6BEA40
MPEGITAECLMENIMETISDNLPKQKKTSFSEDKKLNSVSSEFNRLFGRQKPVHHLLGGGKSADVLLWRDKKISVSCLTGATIVWVLFEWLNYNFLTLSSLAIVIGIVAQFVWKTASGILNRSPSEVPRLVLPEQVFINVGKLVGGEVNRGLNFLQDVACGGNMKKFLVVVLSLLAVAIIGSWCNLLTVIYIGFVAAHTLPVLYERYENEVDSFVSNVLDQFQHNYRKLDTRVLSRIPTGKFRGKKFE